jgi:hypothetical protein
MVPAQQMQAQQGYPPVQQLPAPEEDEDEDDEDEEDEEEEEEDEPVTLNVAAQKSARIALRTLVAKLGKAPEGDWEGIITTAIATEPSIYHYVQAVTVTRALIEAGSNPKFAARIISALRASSFIPSDLRYE